MMRQSALAEVRDLIGRHAGLPCVIPGLTLVREIGPTLPFPQVAEPVFTLIAQGAKLLGFAGGTIEYGAGRSMIISVDLPMEAQVVGATREQPFLGLGLALRPESVAALLLDAGGADSGRGDPPGLALSDLTDDLIDPVLRLLRLHDHPSDIPALATGIEREILWRLINGRQGAMVRQIGLASSRTAQIGRAIRWLRARYAEAMRIEDMARVAGMSVTSFHRHFRNVTSMTPLQYQKQLRLQAARSRLVSSAEDVATVGFAVGYESPSQFSREYRRMFGRPPGQDGERLRRSKGPAARPFGTES